MLANFLVVLLVERDVLDPEWSPDVYLHVRFEGYVVEAGDEDSGPVEAGAICPAGTGLEEKWRVDARDDGPPFDEIGLAAVFAPFVISGVHAMVAETGRMGEEMSVSVNIRLRF